MKTRIILLLVLAAVVSMGIAYADELPATLAVGAPSPVQWDDITVVQNFTYYNTTPKSLNRTRGFIYELDLRASQPTHRWIGYVGNITGNISLMDNDRNRLYGWSLDITSGEVYATRFHGRYNGAATEGQEALDNGSQHMGLVTGDNDYNYVDWTSMGCAPREHIENESIRLGHNSSVDNDDMNRTFQDVTQGMDFEVADRYINLPTDTTDYGAVICSGINLFASNAPSTRWQEIVLEDGNADGVAGDLVYAAIIEDDEVGFNGKTFDFQMMLPQYGQVIKGTTDNAVKESIEYYFYLELIGEGWPTEAVR